MRARWPALALAAALACGGAQGGGGPGRRARELELREGLVEQLEDDLARLADALRARRFEEALAWFEAPCDAPLVLGGRSRVDRPDPFTTRVRHEPETGVRVERGVDAVAPLIALLKGWREVAHVRVQVLDAAFTERDGRAGRAMLAWDARGVGAAGAREAFASEWAAAVEFRRDRYRFRALRVPWAVVRTARRALFDEVPLPAVRRRGVVEGNSERGLVAPFAGSAAAGGIDWTWRGAGAGDLDGDGWCDAVVPGPDANRLLMAGPAGLEDRAAELGLRGPAGGTACLVVDLDGDGDQDVVLGLPGAPGIALLENTGDGFRRRGAESGLHAGPYVYGLCAADFDGDGRLDLYAARYEAFGQVVPASWTDARDAAPNRLFLQVAPLAFRECAAERGVADPRWSYACAAADADGDGDVDLFVANDYGVDGYFENDGRAVFRDRAEAVGLADRGQGMGADWGDADGDGRLDLAVANTASVAARRVLATLFAAPAAAGGSAVARLADGNALYLRRGGGWRDVRRRAGIADGGWSWGGGLVDVDNDGRLDLFWANGFLSGTGGREREGVYWRHVAASTLAVPAVVREKPASPGYLSRQYGPVLTGNARFAGLQRDALFWNRGGARFADVSATSGADGAGDGRGVAFFDHERDGDTDLLVHDLAGPRLLRNVAGQDAAWLRLELVGTRSNRDAIGARVTVRAGGRELLRHVACGAGFASSHDRSLLVGLADAKGAERVTVRWPSGATEAFGPYAARTAHRLVEGAGARR